MSLRALTVAGLVLFATVARAGPTDSLQPMDVFDLQWASDPQVAHVLAWFGRHDPAAPPAP